jgi:hypothetical protein
VWLYDSPPRRRTRGDIVARAIGDDKERGRQLGRRPDYFAAANWPRTAPPGLFLVCTFT